MNPLSPWTYYRRHKRQAILLMVFMSLAVMGLYLPVVPKAGQKAALDAWLENEVAGRQREVSTYGKNQANFQMQERSVLLTFLLMESVMAAVAAIALAGLNYIFVTQRQAEFGVLNALGFTRLQLVWRVVRETAVTTGAALLLSVALCVAGLLHMQFGLYAPLRIEARLFQRDALVVHSPHSCRGARR
jgi:ABC-type antimicrobial peptide transport system permease subunit